jgi:hypothetical protein
VSLETLVYYCSGCLFLTSIATFFTACGRLHDRRRLDDLELAVEEMKKLLEVR